MECPKCKCQMEWLLKASYPHNKEWYCPDCLRHENPFRNGDNVGSC